MSDRLIKAATAARDVLRAEQHFTEHGYTQQAVWDFVRNQNDHPVWRAYSYRGVPGLSRWMKSERKRVCGLLESALNGKGGQ